MKKLLPLPLVLLTLTFLLSGCNPSREASIEERVSESQAALQSTEGGQMLAKAIEGHGGLEKWFSNGLLKFRFVYRMKDRGPEAVVDTIQTIEPWSSLAVHEVPDSEIRFGWTGEQAWILPADAEFSPPPHFWSLTPFYFVGVPFVLADPGTNHELLAEPLAFEGKEYPLVKVTFDPGTGETPDDYYKALIDPETQMIGGVLYIVSDKTLYPDGPAPEKLLTYESYQDVNGIQLPTKFRSFTMVDGEVGEEIRDAEANSYEYLPVDAVNFSVPTGAKVLD